MLLELYVAQQSGKKMPVPSLSMAAHVPPSAALRWTARLEEQGVLARSSDPKEARRCFGYLTEETLSCLDEVLTDSSERPVRIVLKRLFDRQIAH
jgi:DNA-binding MarR family transcriptional regulator